MAIYEHMTHFAGKVVADWQPGEPLGDPGQVIPRISVPWDETVNALTWSEQLAALLDDPRSAEVSGLVVGMWAQTRMSVTSDAAVEALVAAADRLPRLTALFIGDITIEELEISWISQADLSPLLLAYPGLTHFGARGGTGLSLGRLRHHSLRHLTIETGGLPLAILRQVATAELPGLEHLELWLGSAGYGWNGTVDDLAPILSGEQFPRLSYLGLRNSEIADELAKVIVQSPILERIETLDLSLGCLGDEGAAALLESPAVARLKLLDIHHHFCSATMVEKLKNSGIVVDVEEQQEPLTFEDDEEDDEPMRYVAVAE
jgi:hypothetical protein